MAVRNAVARYCSILGCASSSAAFTAGGMRPAAEGWWQIGGSLLGGTLPCSSGQHRHSIGTTAASPTKLDQVVDLAKLAEADAATIHTIWQGYHSDPKMQQVAHNLTGTQFATLQARCKESPLMVVPIRKTRAQGGATDNSFVSVVMQAQLPQHLLLTTVEDFQARGADASCQFMVTFYPELAASKDVVLARGDILNRALLEFEEAQALLPAMCDLYLNDGAYAHVRAFNHSPATFVFDDVLDHFGIGAKVGV